MNSERKNPEQLFDDAVAAVRDEAIDEATVAAALGRVERRLTAELAPATAGETDHRIRGCEGFRGLIPAYLAGALAEPRRILFEDHTRECVPCRRALLEAKRGGTESVSAPGGRRASWISSRWAKAAAVAAVAVGTGLLAGRLGWIGPDASARVRAIDGTLVELDGGALRPVAAGETIARGGRVRTATGSGAVLELADGSRVELAERSELTLARRADGVVLDLDRGALIVEAAKQKRGHLYVRTDDCTVSVVGTIFSVNHGVRGSRVSVLDGEVRVRQGARLAVLRPGDQVATNAQLGRVPLAREISWSRNAAEYEERLAALSALGRELDQTLADVGTRTSTKLLDLAPADTGLWLALPNVSGQLADAWALVEQRVAENEALAAWWHERFSDGASTLELAEAIAELREFGAHLGDEVAIAVSFGAPGAESHEAPLLLAEIADGRGFDELLDEKIARVNEKAGKIALVRVADPATAVESHDTLLVWRTPDDLIAASPSAARLRELAAAIDAGSGGFVGSALHDRLAAVYAGGAGWIAGVDAAAIFARAASSEEDGEHLAASGLGDADQFVFQSETRDGATVSRATFGFRGARHGIASWLSAPAPSGALDFVSAEASFAVAGISKRPEAMFDDLLAMAGSSTGGDPLARLAEAEAKLGFSLRDDLAAALGADFAVALDGPFLPQPSWKVIAEVRDPSRLEYVVGRLVDAVNVEAEAHGHPTLRFSQEEVDGRVYLHLATESGADIAYFGFEDGYLIAAPSRALILDAVALRAAGTSLVRSRQFLDRLPADLDPNFSAVVWQDLASVAGPLVEFVGGEASAEQRQELAALVGEGGPMLIAAYGESDAIRLVALGANGPLGISFERLLALSGMVVDEPAADDGTTTTVVDEVETRVRTTA